MGNRVNLNQTINLTYNDIAPSKEKKNKKIISNLLRGILSEKIFKM